METPQRSKAIFQGSSTCCYGSPPLCFGRTQSFGESSHQMLMSVDGSSSRDTDMQHVMTQMRNVQLEETKVEDSLWQQPPPLQTPEHHHNQLHSQQRLPFQSFAFNRRPRQHDDACFPLSPPLNLSHRHAAENVKPSHHDVGLLPQQERTRSNSFLVHNAPLLPASPDLDLCGRDVLGRSNQTYMPPPICSPFHKYSTVRHFNNVLLREHVSTNDIYISTYMNTCNDSPRAPSPAAMTHTSTNANLPPSMPMITSPCGTPLTDRKLLLKMRPGRDLVVAQQFCSPVESNMARCE